MFGNNAQTELFLSHEDASNEIEDLRNLNDVLMDTHAAKMHRAGKQITALLISNLFFLTLSAALMLYIGLTR